MILSTHAITGAALASLVPEHPIIGFGIGFLSHFALDTIPHWDYSLLSIKRDVNNPINDNMIINKKFVLDFSKIAMDATLGIVLSLLVFSFGYKVSLLAVFSGAIGGIVPDGLQFVYMKWRHEPLISLQKFHIWIHSKKHFNGRPFVGLPLQIGFDSIIILCFSILKYKHFF